ncbi:MAG: HAD family hydrolase [Vicinamibacterales bacterium]
MTGSSRTRAIFFDVDFTLIHPGPMFQGAGYHDFCSRHAVAVDPARFETAVLGAASLLEAPAQIYDPEIFVRYTSRIIEGMGGEGDGIDPAAREIYDAWAACQHFDLYEDVPDVLRAIHGSGVRIGLISNTQRCLTSFEQHFELEGLFSVALSSSAHGYMKPHRSIFEAALARAGADASEAMMVGDSLVHDIEGARAIGMRGVLVARGGTPQGVPTDVPVIASLRELLPLL